MIDTPTQPRPRSVAAIIPCFNEADNIGNILDLLTQVPELNEIIVVDDGSKDNTAEIVTNHLQQDPRLRLIRHASNRGKGDSMFSGWSATTAPFLLFLDADLRNLHPDQIRSLIEPVVKHRAEMTLGLFHGGHFNTDFAHWVTPWLTGQRCLRSDVMRYISKDAASGYGFEIALTVAASQRNYKVRFVPLKGVYHPPSEFHRGILAGIRWRWRMYGQIIRAWFVATKTQRLGRKTYFITFPKP